MTFEGVDHNFEISGLSVADVGISKLSASGIVYNLNKLEDFNGTYYGVKAGVTIAGGKGAIALKNNHGVVLELNGSSQGLKFALGPQGVPCAPNGARKRRAQHALVALIRPKSNSGNRPKSLQWLTMNSDKTVIAVVDDEESICKGLERLLRSAGLTAKTFLNGADFLSFLENGRADCLVLDLNMAPMNGFSILDRLARLGRKMPVIVITGDDIEETYDRAMNQGVAAFLHKPVDGQVLLDAIDEAVGRRA